MKKRENKMPSVKRAPIRASEKGAQTDQRLTETAISRILPANMELVPQLNEVYELELAYGESRMLTDDEIIRNGAYFARVGESYTRHFLMCSGEPLRLPKHSSSRLRHFFKTNQFKTGYATHGLFPYRGKFHPQMIKGLLNVMGLKPGNTVVDPMMGSGTVLIEARLMGIDSIGIDASPFCQFMTQCKLDALTMPLEPIRIAQSCAREVFDYFAAFAGQPKRGRKQVISSVDLFDSHSSNFDEVSERKSNGKLPVCCQTENSHNFLLLAYLDSAGYSERSTTKPPFEQFVAILERYLQVSEKIQVVLDGMESALGASRSLVGDARGMEILDASVDGVIFSPPYSFAIDYLDNDAFHLNYMGIDLSVLRGRMVGLRGGKDMERFELYKSDMDKVLAECARILKRGAICTIVVGTNNNQLSKIQGVSPDKVEGIDQLLIDAGERHNLSFVRRIERQINGMANTMRTEYIILLQRQ